MRIHHHIISVLLLPVLASACAKDIPVQQETSGPAQAASWDIDASCSMVQINGPEHDGSAAGIMTRSIIGQTTITEAIDANFIKLDEVRQEWPREQYKLTDGPAAWNSERTSILNAEVLSSPDNTDGIHFRSIVFNPRQTYEYYSYDDDGDPATENMLVGYISRMVGWYPKTFDLPPGTDGKPADTRFIDASGTYRIVDGQVCVRFPEMLDGETDVMMTDMREGRYDLRQFGLGFMNNLDLDRDVQPYGHMFNSGSDGAPDAGNGYQYCNYFTFNHYLTAIRLFVKADESDLSLISWKQIDDVIFTDQPSTVTIALPTVQSRGKDGDPGTNGEMEALVPGTTPTLPVENVAPAFGKAVSWEDPRNMHIIRTAMAQNDPDHPEFAEIPQYPVTMDHGVSLSKAYLGYMLVQPEQDTGIEIHTDAGVFSATIPAEISTGTAKEEILKAGHIYNIVIDIKADGSLDVVIGNEDMERYRNLAPYNETINSFEYSNCYMVTPDMFGMTDENGDDVVDADGNKVYYDGFYFQAMVAGRGEMGTISSASAELYPEDPYFNPHSARILWQDENYLIRHVELVHGYVRFALDEKCRTGEKKGNAVIAVYDEAGDIIWSWHIWVTDKPQDIEYSFSSGGTGYRFRMMNLNLGARKATCAGPDDALDTYGLYYLWGRKDPSPGPPEHDYPQSDTRTMTYWYMDQGVRTSVDVIQDINPTIEMSARNPLALLMPSRISETYASDWLYSSVDQLWGYSPAAGEVRKKTIYDPCPYGYRVADDEIEALFDYCLTSGYYSDTGYGITVTTGWPQNFFPFAGWRGRDSGTMDRTMSWYKVGELGDYQDARINKSNDDDNNHRGRSLLIRNSLFINGSYKIENTNDAKTYYQRLNTDWGNRSSAAPVRCIRYDQGIDQEP